MFDAVLERDGVLGSLWWVSFMTTFLLVFVVLPTAHFSLPSHAFETVFGETVGM